MNLEDHLEIPKYSKKSKGKRLNKDEGFVVKHFAGSVIYTSQNFLDKNNDTIHQDLIDLLYISNDSYFKGLFPVSENEDEYIPTANRRFKVNNFSLLKEYLCSHKIIEC